MSFHLGQTDYKRGEERKQLRIEEVILKKEADRRGRLPLSLEILK